MSWVKYDVVVLNDGDLPIDDDGDDEHDDYYENSNMMHKQNM